VSIIPFAALIRRSNKLCLGQSTNAKVVRR
jgi:hypothetical protein